MKSSKFPPGPKTPIRRQRPSYSCTECSRRKLRCSKRIPCLSCIERGIESQCRLRQSGTERQKEQIVAAVGLEDATPQTQPASSVGARHIDNEYLPRNSNVSDALGNELAVDSELFAESETQLASSQKRHKILDTVSQDAAVILEFLVLSRQQILNAANFNHPQQQKEEGNTFEEIDPIFRAEQIGGLMVYHEENIAWIHNVVHMPTFRRQCEEAFLSNKKSSIKAWIPLYYAMISVTLYHAHPSKLEDFEILSGFEISLLCYQKAIDSLNAVDFMKNHNIYSVQAICLLIYIGHHSGQSDRMSVLLASASRIAQCLGLHRLGSFTPSSILNCDDSDIRRQLLIDREVSKRAWWFLVRQDWLQIPFNNTYNIHPSQFDTQMPKNCDEEFPKIESSTDFVEKDQDHYTQGSYTSVLNKASVIIWNLQDRMCRHPKPDVNEGKDGDYQRQIYSEVLQADRELKQLVDEMPRFFRSPHKDDTEPMKMQRSVLSISIAHKFYSIHRHFQILSLKDPWFAYTKVSCLPLMRRCLTEFLSLLDNLYAYTVNNLWTLNAQVLTAAVWLLFELIFSKNEKDQIFEIDELRDLALQSLRFLQTNQHKSSIAKRGVGLIESLLDTERAIETGMKKQFSLKEIISRVEVDEKSVADVPMESSFDPYFSQMTDIFAGDNTAWEDIFSIFDM